MKNTEAMVSSAHPVELLSKMRVRGIVFVIVTALLMVLFWSPLVRLLQHISKVELNSYIPLLPLVSAYLLWSQRAQLSSLWDYRVPIAALFGGIGLAAILFCQIDISHDLVRKEGNLLSLQILAFISLVAALLLFLLGKANLTRATFPVGFLFLVVPLPETAVRWLTLFLQHASADTAYGLFMVTGTPVFRDGLSFALPGLKVIVAEECSGIRSTLVLFITSLLAGHLFLRKPWGKWILALAVVPIGILRNGFRILTICWLTVNLDSRVIESPIHHRGGPFFFVLSLVPLLGLLVYLRRWEGRLAATKSS